MRHGRGSVLRVLIPSEGQNEPESQSPPNNIRATRVVSAADCTKRRPHGFCRSACRWLCAIACSRRTHSTPRFRKNRNSQLRRNMGALFPCPHFLGSDKPRTGLERHHCVHTPLRAVLRRCHMNSNTEATVQRQSHSHSARCQCTNASPLVSAQPAIHTAACSQAGFLCQRKGI